MVLCGALSLSSCADEDFYQQDALATAQETSGKAAAGTDSAWVVAGRHYNRSGFHRFFWGDHYREVWAEPVKLPILQLDSLYGGLRVVKQGGGFQTTSFHLQDSTGRLYALRSADKDPVDVVPHFWRQTFVANILRDQTSASIPYGALIVPALAQAAGLYHTNPRLYYIPAQDSSFGEFAPAVRGKVFMLEEKFEGPADLSPVYAGLIDFEDSEDALRKRFSSNYYHFDQRTFAKARLLDLLIGDWDRHKGQWDWAVQPQGLDTVFIPVPKDRDQVFLQMKDGVIPFIATSKLLARKFQSFSPAFSDVSAYMINAEFIDARLLHTLSREEWQAIAQELQQNMSDAVLESAVQQLPVPIFKIVGERITQRLKSRRDELPRAAEKMYQKLAKEVTIPGSDGEEKFTVWRLQNGSVKVQVQRMQDEQTLYMRIFNPAETEQIILHGLAGDDTFIVLGNADKSIPVRIYGGLGEDEIRDTSSVSGWKKYTYIYDTPRGNEIRFGPSSSDKTTHDVRVHAYDREGN